LIAVRTGFVGITEGAFTDDDMITAAHGTCHFSGWSAIDVVVFREDLPRLATGRCLFFQVFGLRPLEVVGSLFIELSGGSLQLNVFVQPVNTLPVLLQEVGVLS